MGEAAVAQPVAGDRRDACGYAAWGKPAIKQHTFGKAFLMSFARGSLGGAERDREPRSAAVATGEDV